MITNSETITIDVLEVLPGQKTTLVCKKCEISSVGELQITDLHENVRLEGGRNPSREKGFLARRASVGAEISP